MCGQCSPKTTKNKCSCGSLVPVILQADLSPADLADFEKSNAGWKKIFSSCQSGINQLFSVKENSANVSFISGH